ncbi:retrovirus-related pol polyprotein from transposon TNT 1-94, partial [Tanacetum coccineum]
MNPHPSMEVWRGLTYTLVIVDESQGTHRMVENQNNVKVKQIRTDNETEFRNHELESFCDEKGISQNFSSPYTPGQNGVAESKNRTLIEAARTILNGSVLSKHFWTDLVRIACYTQNRSIIVKRHNKTSYEIFRERIPDISYFHMFGCPAFRVYNTRRQQIEETYHVTFDESMEAIRFTNTLVDEIGINDSSRYPPDEFQGDDISRQYQVDSDNDQMITQPTDIPSGNNTEVLGSIPESLVPDVTQSHILNQASTRSHPAPQDRWNKKDEHGTTTKNKARLVAQGYSEEEGIDYDEIFAQVARMEAIRIFLAFATYMNFKVYQMDVKSAFLNGKLKEEVYVKRPPGFESSEFPVYVCKFDKSLYALKQAPRTCYTLCKQFEKLMTKKFKMSMMGELTYFLGLQIKQDDKGISIRQEQYTRNLLKKYEISDSSSVKTPMVPPNNLGPDLAGKLVNETSYRGMIGSLMYLTATRPDIQFSTVLCARYQSNPKKSHLTDVKRILRYLKGTPTLGLYYPKCLGFDLKGYSDSDYASCNMDRKSTSGACQILGGKLVCWSAKKQQSVAMSLAEDEYVAAAGCCVSILWMKSQLSDYDIHYKMVPIFCDNTSAIAISNNLVLHSRTKHIDIRYHFIRDHILKGDIKLHFIPTEYQLVDIFTKPLDEPTFTRQKAEPTMYCPLYNAFTNCPSVVYQNFLREFWSTVVAFDPFPSTDEPEKRLLKEFLIKFSVLNGKIPMTLDFHTFCSSTDLNYNNGKYVDHPTPEVSEYTQDKKFGFLPPILSNSNFTKDPSKVTNIELTAHMIVVHNQRDSVSPPPLAVKPKKGKSQTVASTLPKDITSTTFNKGATKTTPRPEGSLGDKDLEGNIPPANMEPIHTPVAGPSGIGDKYQAFLLSKDKLEKESDEEEVLAPREYMDEDIQADEEVRTPSPKQDQPEPSYASIDQYYDENITHRDQNNKLVEASLSSIDSSSTTISDLYKGLDVITQLLKDINNVIKDDPAANQKINEATETFTGIYSNITEDLNEPYTTYSPLDKSKETMRDD